MRMVMISGLIFTNSLVERLMVRETLFGDDVSEAWVAMQPIHIRIDLKRRNPAKTY